MTERYTKVKVILQQVRPWSVMVTREIDSTQWLSIPRTLVHGADDMRELERLKNVCPVETTIRVMAWKAKELNLK